MTNYTFSLGVIYGISAAISMANAILRLVLEQLAHCERPHSLTQQLELNTSKTWVVTFVNTGLVLLLINANYIRVPLPKNSPILRGPYKDFNTEWYGAVGATICVSIIIETLMPLFSLSYYFLAGLLRCWDRSCSCTRSRTKQLLQNAYEAIYIGREFNISYSQALIITLTWLVMMYSTAMPILYPCAALGCALSYVVEKYLFLRLYRIPPRYGLELAHELEH